MMSAVLRTTLAASLVMALASTAYPQSTNYSVVLPDAKSALPEAPAKSLLVGVQFADIGYSDGFRFSNLGGRREIYVPIPQGIALSLAELVLVLDDVSAHDARRSLEVLVNDRSVSAIALDGKGSGRTVRISLANVTARNGFLKLSFLYSGAATLDRCIDVRYVGDSVTIRPESSVELDIGTIGPSSITATAALMPKNIAILLSNPVLPSADIAAALTLARSLAAAGRRVTFHHGVDSLADLTKREDPRRWTRGLIVVGALDRVSRFLDVPAGTLADLKGAGDISNTVAVARISGIPILLVTDTASASAGTLIENPSLAVLRDTSSASIAQAMSSKGFSERVSFDELGLVPGQVEVFGRAELSVVIASRTLPNGARPSRLILEIMVAPDGAGEKAVVSAFVNDRLLASTVAVIGGPTQLDFPFPAGLIGTVANIRVVVQRRSAQGDCRFEPQGYPAELLGSSSIILSPAGSAAEDFSDLAALWANGIEVLIPAAAATRPLSVVGMLGNVLHALSKESAPIAVKFVDAGVIPRPTAPFVVVSDLAPEGVKKNVRFDRGRVVVADRNGRTRLDVGGLTTGAVAQLVSSGPFPGLWIKPLANDGSLPISPGFNLDRGDVAFVDKAGIALALSTARDTLLRISYPEQISWMANVDRFRPWIFGGLWGLVTVLLLFGLQRIYRRRRASASR